MKMHGIVWAYILVLILKNLDISRFMEIYRITKPGVYLTIPNFILLFVSLKSLDLSMVSGFCSFRSSPLLYHFFTILSLTYVQLHSAGLKLPYTGGQ